MHIHFKMAARKLKCLSSTLSVIESDLQQSYKETSLYVIRSLHIITNISEIQIMYSKYCDVVHLDKSDLFYLNVKLFILKNNM